MQHTTDRGSAAGEPACKSEPPSLVMEHDQQARDDHRRAGPYRAVELKAPAGCRQQGRADDQHQEAAENGAAGRERRPDEPAALQTITVLRFPEKSE